MSCTQIKTLIPLYVGGDLSAGKSELIREHFETCAHCREFAAEFEESRNWLIGLIPPRFDEAVLDDLGAAVQREIAHSQTRPSWNPRLILVASMALLALLIGLGIYADQRQKPEVPLTLIPSEETAPLISKIGMDKASKSKSERQNARRSTARKQRPEPLPDQGTIALNQDSTEQIADQEMLRIEIQTADPNIRIIWFAPSNPE